MSSPSLSQEGEEAVKSVPDCQTRSSRPACCTDHSSATSETDQGIKYVAHADISFRLIHQESKWHECDAQPRFPCTDMMSGSPVSKGGKLSGSSLNSASI